MKQKLNFTKEEFDAMTPDEKNALAEAVWNEKRIKSENAKSLKEKYGADYYSRINSMRKTRRGRYSKPL